MTEEDIKAKVEEFKRTFSNQRPIWGGSESRDLVEVIRNAIVYHTRIDESTGVVTPASLRDVAAFIVDSSPLKRATIRAVHLHESDWNDSQFNRNVHKLNSHFEKLYKEIDGISSISYSEGEDHL